MKARGEARTLAFDASCCGCLKRIHARQDLAVEVVSGSGHHRGWAHAECAASLTSGASRAG